MWAALWEYFLKDILYLIKWYSLSAFKPSPFTVSLDPFLKLKLKEKNSACIVDAVLCPPDPSLQ